MADSRKRKADREPVEVESTKKKKESKVVVRSSWCVLYIQSQYNIYGAFSHLTSIAYIIIDSIPVGYTIYAYIVY